MGNSKVKGHGFAMLTILIWGTTFISTKILLRDFNPIEILVYRFAIGYLVLTLAFPHRLKLAERKQEWLFAGAGLCGVTLYFLLENIALIYSLASNVGIIISVAPFITAILAHRFLEGEKLKVNFFVGFVAAITGIILISFNGSVILKLNPVGDILAVLAAVVWAVYSILTRKISAYGYNTIQTTRRIFLYGIAFIIPTLFFFDFKLGVERLLKPVNLFNLLFLGIAASALGFVLWNVALKLLGAVKTSLYIYLVPVITVITSIIVLGEQITYISMFGMVLTLVGLFVSEQPNKMEEKMKEMRRQYGK